MAEYRTFSKHISYELVDPQSKPEVARQYKAQAMDDVVVAAGDRTERLTQSGEQDLTNAILKITRDKPKTICFIEGHGEKQIAGAERDGYNTADKKLKGENYETKAINLVSSNEVPPECSVVVDAGPTKTFFPEKRYDRQIPRRGRQGIILVGPEMSPVFGCAQGLEHRPRQTSCSCQRRWPSLRHRGRHPYSADIRLTPDHQN